MSATYQRQGSGWGVRIAWVILLILVGAALATWGLSHWEAGARFFGVQPNAPLAAVRTAAPSVAQTPVNATPAAADTARIAALESRLAAIEGKAQAAAGSAGRADALLIAFAARRAVDRGVALGYLEPLLVQRFGERHQAAVATVVTASRNPVQLDELTSRFQSLGPSIRGGGPEEGWWSGFKRELGSVVSIHRADVASPQPQARYDRALARLKGGEVDAALAEVMRMPGAANADAWIADARRYVAAHRALDELESAALLGGGNNQSTPSI